MTTLSFEDHDIGNENPEDIISPITVTLGSGQEKMRFTLMKDENGRLVGEDHAGGTHQFFNTAQAFHMWTLQTFVRRTGKSIGILETDKKPTD